VRKVAKLKNNDVRYTVILIGDGMVLRVYPFKNHQTAERLAQEEAANPNRISDAQHVVLWDMATQVELFSTYGSYYPPGPKEWRPD